MFEIDENNFNDEAEESRKFQEKETLKEKSQLKVTERKETTNDKIKETVNDKILASERLPKLPMTPSATERLRDLAIAEMLGEVHDLKKVFSELKIMADETPNRLTNAAQRKKEELDSALTASAEQALIHYIELMHREVKKQTTEQIKTIKNSINDGVNSLLYLLVAMQLISFVGIGFVIYKLF